LFRTAFHNRTAVVQSVASQFVVQLKKRHLMEQETKHGPLGKETGTKHSEAALCACSQGFLVGVLKDR
jgi:hypothetical protein